MHASSYPIGKTSQFGYLRDRLDSCAGAIFSVIFAEARTALHPDVFFSLTASSSSLHLFYLHSVLGTGFTFHAHSELTPIRGFVRGSIKPIIIRFVCFAFRTNCYQVGWNNGKDTHGMRVRACDC